MPDYPANTKNAEDETIKAIYLVPSKIPSSVMVGLDKHFDAKVHMIMLAARFDTVKYFKTQKPSKSYRNHQELYNFGVDLTLRKRNKRSSSYPIQLFNL